MLQPGGHGNKLSRQIESDVTAYYPSILNTAGEVKRTICWLERSRINSPFTDHDGNVMAVWQRQGAVHVQDVVLCAQEALQVLRVRGHLLGHGIHAPRADQSFHEQQRHSFLLAVHHHLQKPEHRGGKRVDLWWKNEKQRAVYYCCTIGGSGSFGVDIMIPPAQLWLDAAGFKETAEPWQRRLNIKALLRCGATAEILMTKKISISWSPSSHQLSKSALSDNTPRLNQKQSRINLLRRNR